MIISAALCSAVGTLPRFTHSALALWNHLQQSQGNSNSCSPSKCHARPTTRIAACKKLHRVCRSCMFALQLLSLRTCTQCSPSSPRLWSDCQTASGPGGTMHQAQQQQHSSRPLRGCGTRAPGSCGHVLSWSRSKQQHQQVLLLPQAVQQVCRPAHLSPHQAAVAPAPAAAAGSWSGSRTPATRCSRRSYHRQHWRIRREQLLLLLHSQPLGSFLQ